MSPSTPERWGWVPLGQMLVQDGILTDEQVAAALERQRKTKERLGQVLIEMRLIDEEGLGGLVLSIASINVWNRLNAATRQVAGAYAG